MEFNILTLGLENKNIYCLKKHLSDIALVNSIKSIDFINAPPDFIIYYPNLENNYSFINKETIQLAKYINRSNKTKLLFLSHQFDYKNINLENSINLEKPYLIEKNLRNICSVTCIRIPQIISYYPINLIEKSTFLNGLFGINYNIQFILMNSLANKIKIIIQRPKLKKNYIIHGCYCTIKDLHYEINKFIYIQLPIFYVPQYFLDLFEKYISFCYFKKWKSIPEFKGKCHHKLNKIVSSWLNNFTTNTRFLLEINEAESSI